MTDLHLQRETTDDLSTEMIRHIFHSFAPPAYVRLHTDLLRGENGCHRAESAFKALALAIKQATTRTSSSDVPSPKDTSYFSIYGSAGYWPNFAWAGVV